MSWCDTPQQSSGFVSSMVRFVDCQAEALGSAPYQALAAPGSTLSIVLTGFLTIFIALIGYNLLLGRSFTVRSATLAAVKIGAVFALATSWPAYRTLVYDLVTDGPAQIVSDIGRPAAVPGSDGSLLQRLDLADGAMVQLAILGPGNTVVARTDIAPPPFGGFDAFALGGARILFLLTATAGLGVVRIIAGLMLALGPFFIAFVLFDSTRSLFEGWVRVLAGAALAAVGVALALGLQLALIEPWLAGVLARRLAGEALPSVPVELLVVTSMFALTVLAVLAACLWLARAFRMAPLAGYAGERPDRVPSTARQEQPAGRASAQSQDERTRARAVADVLVSMQRREVGGSGIAGASRVPALASGRDAGLTPARVAHVPVGRSFRRARPRHSASTGKRDLR